MMVKTGLADIIPRLNYYGFQTFSSKWKYVDSLAYVKHFYLLLRITKKIIWDEP